MKDSLTQTLSFSDQALICCETIKNHGAITEMWHDLSSAILNGALTSKEAALLNILTDILPDLTKLINLLQTQNNEVNACRDKLIISNIGLDCCFQALFSSHFSHGNTWYLLCLYLCEENSLTTKQLDQLHQHLPGYGQLLISEELDSRQARINTAAVCCILALQCKNLSYGLPDKVITKLETLICNQAQLSYQHSLAFVQYIYESKLAMSLNIDGFKSLLCIYDQIIKRILNTNSQLSRTQTPPLSVAQEVLTNYAFSMFKLITSRIQQTLTELRNNFNHDQREMSRYSLFTSFLSTETDNFLNLISSENTIANINSENLYLLSQTYNLR